MPIEPVMKNERSELLDFLRSFALLGIAIANMGVFSIYAFLPDAPKEQISTHAVDEVLAFFLTALVEGKFYSLFSLLFGIGFTIILERISKKGKNALLIFYRRLFVLMILGFMHALLVWDGDILLLYALLGMFLPLFRNISDRSLIITAVILILLPIIIDVIKVITKGSFKPNAWFEANAMKVDSGNGITETNYMTYLTDNKNYNAVLNWNQGGLFWRYDYIISTNRIPKVFAMFLIGLIAGRRKMHANISANIPLLKKIRNYGFILGLPASFAFAYFSDTPPKIPAAKGLLDTIFYALSVIPLSLAFTSALAIYWQQSSKKLASIISPAGRMALTNYIVQSIIAISIFYGFGLGLGSKVGPSFYIPIAILIFILQVIYSTIWLRYFQYGPMEWIWRMLTYGKIIPIRNK